MRFYVGITLAVLLVALSGLLLAMPSRNVDSVVSPGHAAPSAAPPPIQAQPQATPNPVRQMAQPAVAAQPAPVPVMAEATPAPDAHTVNAQPQPFPSILAFIVGSLIMLAVGLLYKVSAKAAYGASGTIAVEA